MSDSDEVIENSETEDDDPNEFETVYPVLSAKAYEIEKMIVRDINNPKIYRKRYIKSTKGTSQAYKKVHDRVYDNYHPCFICGELQSHINIHLKSHRTDDLAKQVLSGNKNDMANFRKMGDNKHNQQVIEQGWGEIVLGRRPRDDNFDVAEYGPCPSCHEWLRLKTMKDHMRTNHKKDEGANSPKRDIIVQAQVLAGHFRHTPTKQMLEVFGTMRMDDVTKKAQNDLLILLLGQSWMRRSIENKEKRCNYTSQHMRLVAKMLMHLQQMSQDDGAEEHNELWAYIHPRYFENVAEAALLCSLPLMDDEEELKAPSNAIRLKHDIVRMANAKWAYIVKKDGVTEEATACQTFLSLIDIEWADTVTRKAQAVLHRRRYETCEFLDPADVEKLTKFIMWKLARLQLRSENFMALASLALARLTMYNRRLSGEVEVVK